jgi:hypothetical protein
MADPVVLHALEDIRQSVGKIGKIQVAVGINKHNRKA